MVYIFISVKYEIGSSVVIVYHARRYMEFRMQQVSV